MSARIADTAGRSEYWHILEDAWRAHLAPRAPGAPTVVSLFAGCGGSSLGYSMAGYDERLAVEWDDHAVACFRVNFPNVPVFHGDLATLPTDEALRMARVKPGELDVLDGSPPCQGFTTAGKRLFHDPRNGLFREYVRLLDAFKPKAFVMENVSGLVKGKMKLIFADMMRTFKMANYAVSAKLMNAMYFHVPQHRERVIVVGIRHDVPSVPSHPKALRWPFTVDDALRGCTPHTFTGDNVSKNHVYRSATTRRKADRPFGTISGRMNRHGIHPWEHRYFALEEIQRAASFPDGFQWIGTPFQREVRIGNSVPPLFMRAIALHLRTLLQTRALECCQDGHGIATQTASHARR